MGLHQLSNYLLTCERDPFTGFGGCGSELHLEQKRSMKDAADAALEQGWLACPLGPWDVTPHWFVLCPDCKSQREAKLAAQRGEQMNERPECFECHEPILEFNDLRIVTIRVDGKPRNVWVHADHVKSGQGE